MHRRVLITTLTALLAFPAAAQVHRNPGRGPAIGGPVLPRAPRNGFPNRAMPQPNRWRGDFGRFNTGPWDGGHWYHGLHGGSLAWWWVVGPNWYFYDRPVYPYPDTYSPPGREGNWWYWCDASQEYYPYVTYCPSGWVRVPPR